MWYEYIKIRGYDGTPDKGVDPGIFEVFQGIGPAGSSGGGPGGGPGGDGESLYSVLKEISDKIGVTGDPENNIEASPTVADAIAELEGELITLEGIFAGLAAAYGIQNIALNTQLAAFQVEFTATAAAVVALETTLVEMAATIEQIEDHLDAGLTRTDIGGGGLEFETGYLKDIYDLLEKALGYTLQAPGNPFISYFAELVDRIEALQFNDQEIDLGPIRIWLRSRVIEY